MLGNAKYSVTAKLSTEKSRVRVFAGNGNTDSKSSVLYDSHVGEDAVRDNDFNIELLFKALADPTRLRLIQLLGDEEVCVCAFVETLKTNQSKVSRHLAYLRRAGLVRTRREGKWIHYRLVEPSNPRASKIFQEVRDWLANCGAD